ncbi:MAG: threonine synthase, partial [Balneolaceae bacterium]
AVGYLGLMDYYRNNKGTGIVLETAHPIKFRNTVEEQILREVPMPQHVELTNLEKKSIPFSTDFEEFRSFLMEK